MTKQTSDKTNRQGHASGENQGSKRIDQDDRELEKLEREQQKARTGGADDQKKPAADR